MLPCARQMSFAKKKKKPEGPPLFLPIDLDHEMSILVAVLRPVLKGTVD